MEGVTGPPTDLLAVSRKLGITDFVEDDIPYSGELDRKRDGTTVVYSRHLSPSRRRFTIAHELAHGMFDQPGRRFPRTGKELERLCDMIATELLMPRTCFRKAVG